MSLPTTTTVYGEITPQSSKSLVVSKVKERIGFKYPLELTPSRGYFSKYVGEPLLKSMIRSLLRTQRGERFMLPKYGCNLKKFLMEPLDKVTFSMIQKEVHESIINYLKIIDLKKIRVFESGSTTGLYKILNVKLNCELRADNNLNFDVNIKV